MSWAAYRLTERGLLFWCHFIHEHLSFFVSTSWFCVLLSAFIKLLSSSSRINFFDNFREEQHHLHQHRPGSRRNYYSCGGGYLVFSSFADTESTTYPAEAVRVRFGCWFCLWEENPRVESQRVRAVNRRPTIIQPCFLFFVVQVVGSSRISER